MSPGMSTPLQEDGECGEGRGGGRSGPVNKPTKFHVVLQNFCINLFLEEGC